LIVDFSLYLDESRKFCRVSSMLMLSFAGIALILFKLR